MSAATAGRSVASSGSSAKNPPQKPSKTSELSGRLRRSQAASVTTGQQVRSGGVRDVRASLHRRGARLPPRRGRPSGRCRSGRRQSRPKPSMCSGLVLRSAGKPLAEPRRPRRSARSRQLAGRPRPECSSNAWRTMSEAGAFLPGFGLQFLLEPFFDPDVDPFHKHSSACCYDCQTIYHVGLTNASAVQGVLHARDGRLALAQARHPASNGAACKSSWVLPRCLGPERGDAPEPMPTHWGAARFCPSHPMHAGVPRSRARVSVPDRRWRHPAD